MNDRQQYDLGELIMKSLNDTASESDFEQLRQFLAGNPEAMAYYLEYISLYASLQSPGDVSFPQLDDDFDLQTWESLAKYEKTAEIVDHTPPILEKSGISAEQIPLRKTDWKIRRNSLITFIVSVAALVMLILLARFLPSATGIEVATLTDGMKAKWSDSSDSKEIGARLLTGYTPLSLQEGIIELQFDNTAKVIIEGPAEFSLLTEDQIKLNYGKLYAVVPAKAIGFTVNTPNSRIIDMGTEFGIQAESNSATELHVIKGKINLLAGTTHKTTMEVHQGSAKRVSGNDSRVHDIPVIETLFARHINSKTAVIWRGQKQMDLADVMGGGNGFGTGRTDVWLDLADGKEGTKLILNPDRQQFSEEELTKLEKRLTDNRYHRVSHLPYVDGVFSPDGRAGSVQVTSQGHAWKDCPGTSGIYFEDIFTGSHITTSYTHNLVLNNQIYGTEDNPAIALHSNAGITFNLQAIRRDMPNFEIVRFTAICGVSQEANRRGNKEDFRVLVDGQKRFEAIGLEYDSGPREISIPLSSQDRFLTLVSTDGDLYPNNDWGFFGKPCLEIETVSKSTND